MDEMKIPGCGSPNLCKVNEVNTQTELKSVPLRETCFSFKGIYDLLSYFYSLNLNSNLTTSCPRSNEGNYLNWKCKHST